MTNTKKNPVEDFTDQNGRVNYNRLVKHIKKINIDYFIKNNRHPFLVGKELYDGLLSKDEIKNAKTLPLSRSAIIDDTAFFKLLQDQKRKIASSNSITRAMFMLKKKPFSKELSDTITLGRHSENDLVVADYSISRHHANIVIHYDRYFLVDTGSTNGSFIDGEELQPKKKYKLPLNCVVAFGRIAFMFMEPKELYEMVENETL